MEREDKLKKVVKEKRSVKKTKASTALPAAAEIKKAPPQESANSAPAEASKKKIEDPTIEQIQLRAYFLGERRASFGISGDSTSDWVQAERELKEEAGPK
jgi:hypothetical protein